MIGNSEMITQTTTRDVWPVPHQNEISGTMARIGMAWSITMYGNTARSMSRVWLISTAIAMPSTIEMARPIKATRALDHNPARISEKASRSKKPSCTTSCGGSQQEAAAGRQHDVGDEVPATDDRRAEHERGQDDRAHELLACRRWP